MNTFSRRYDIDWLRVIAIALLLIYHIAIAFQPWGVLIGFIQNSESLEWLWIPMSMINIWRIPLLFFVSGMGVSFALRSRSIKQLLFERSKRILLPFVFGIFVIVPIHVIIWQRYYSQDISYVLTRSHLWFLMNIFLYVLVLTPLFYVLKKNYNGRISKFLRSFIQSPVSYITIVLFFILETFIVKPDNYVLYAMTTHGYVMGFLAFFFGYLIANGSRAVWDNFTKWKWLFMLISVGLYLVRLFVFELNAANYLLAIETCTWTFTLFGLAYKYLNKPGKTLAYLSQGAYPIYIIHMFFLYLASYLIFPLSIPIILKFLLVCLITFLTCWLSYEFLIRRVKYVRILFGLKQ